MKSFNDILNSMSHDPYDMREMISNWKEMLSDQERDVRFRFFDGRIVIVPNMKKAVNSSMAVHSSGPKEGGYHYLRNGYVGDHIDAVAWEGTSQTTKVDTWRVWNESFATATLGTGSFMNINVSGTASGSGITLQGTTSVLVNWKLDADEVRGREWTVTKDYAVGGGYGGSASLTWRLDPNEVHGGSWDSNGSSTVRSWYLNTNAVSGKDWHLDSDKAVYSGKTYRFKNLWRKGEGVLKVGDFDVKPRTVIEGSGTGTVQQGLVIEILRSSLMGVQISSMSIISINLVFYYDSKFKKKFNLSLFDYAPSDDGTKLEIFISTYERELFEKLIAQFNSSHSTTLGMDRASDFIKRDENSAAGLEIYYTD